MGGINGEGLKVEGLERVGVMCVGGREKRRKNNGEESEVEPIRREKVWVGESGEEPMGKG
jgi:hypothetical protein